MWITGIHIKNFRCYGDPGEILHATKGMNVVVGENNAGKSSIFAAVDACLRIDQLQFNDAPWGSNALKSELAIDIEFGTDGIEVCNALLGIALKSLKGEGTQAALKEYDELVRLFGTNARLVLKSSSDRTHIELFLSGVELQQESKSASEQKSLYALMQDIDRNTPLPDAIRNAPQLIQLGVNPAQTVSRLVRERIHKFADVRQRPRGSSSAESMQVRQSLEGVQTADLLMNLKVGNPTMRSKFNSISERFREFFPGYSFEVTRNQSGTAEIVINRNGFEFDINAVQAGTGLFEILTLLSNLEGAERRIFVIEEPGAHLHPQAQRALHALITKSSSKNQVFVITHSPMFVDWVSFKGLSRCHSVGTTSKISQFPSKLDSKSEASLIEALRDPRRREMVFARAVGLVEGETERSYLEEIAPRAGVNLDALGISMISVEGEHQYEPYLKYLTALDIPVKCLRDKAKGIPQKWKSLFTVVGSEFEDLMREAGFDKQLKQAALKVGTSKARQGRYLGASIPLKKMPEVHRSFLKQLRSLV